MLELRGGSGGISQLAFSRGLSGGNLDKGVCFVSVAALQPKSKTTGLPSYFNSQDNYDTWHETPRGIPSTSQVLRDGCHASKRPSTVLSTRTTGGNLGGPNTAMDNIGHMQGHLQCKYG
eukprot:4130280-Pyramimonas_sp.AAC.1